MSNPPIELRIRFWQHSYARASFVDAKSFAELILRGEPEGNAPILKALSIATIVAYSRPFKRANPNLKLSEDIVPAQHRSAHKDLIDYRDMVIAHRDLNGPIADWGHVSQLLLEIDDQGFSPRTLTPIFSPEKAAQTICLTEDLIRSMDLEMGSFVQAYSSHLRRQAGLYTMNLQDDSSDWLLPALDTATPCP